MALSQKHEGKCLVPWFCSAEWHFVYNKIFGANSNEITKREALDILNIWKARTPFLSRGVEGTFIILEAVLLDRKIYDDYNLKLLLSSSVMRFLNICAAYNKFQGTFYSTAYKMKIPEWLINLRHDIAHGQSLPSLDILDRALKFSLEWLHQEYWKVTALQIRDFIDDTQFECDKNESLRSCIQPLVSNYSYITLLTHPNWSHNIIQDIPEEETRNLFLKEVKSITNLHNLNNDTKLQDILKVIWEKIEEILKDFEDLEIKYQILAELVVDDVFLGNIDGAEEIFKDGNKIPKNFIMLWENMLMNFNKDMLEELIKRLLNVCATENYGHQSRNVAAVWLLEIGKGLEKCMYIKKVTKEINKTGLKPKKVIQSILEKKLGNKYGKKKILNFNTSLELPNIIINFEIFKEFFLQKPTEYLKIFLSELLDLNEQLKESPRREQILNLINVYVFNKDLAEETPIYTKVHSVEDLESSTLNLNGDSQNQMETEDISNENSLENSEHVTENPNKNQIWRKVIEINFEKCPIGILPWQSSAMNPFLV